MNIKDLAKKSVSLGRIMSERSEKIDTETIIKYHPNGITIDDFEEILLNGESVYVYTFAENKTGFVFAGLVLKNLFKEIVENYGDEQKALAALKEEKGLKVKLTRAKTKDGKKELTRVEIMD